MRQCLVLKAGFEWKVGKGLGSFMRNADRKGKKLKRKDGLIFNRNTGFMYLNASEFAKRVGVSPQAVNKALREGKSCKGWSIERTNVMKGPFYYDENYELFR